MAQVVKNLCKALSSNPNTTKKKIKQNNKKKQTKQPEIKT
jgi:hypothetical protein